MVNFPQAALVVGRDGTAMIDLVTGSLIKRFTGPINSIASTIFYTYKKKGSDGIMNPVNLLTGQSDRAAISVWSWGKVS